MTKTRVFGVVTSAVCCALGACAVPAAAATPTWQLDQPPPPQGARYKVPLGTPGDMEFYAPNRGLLSVSGNATIPAGLYAWDGQSWHQLATVCGGDADTSRIAFAGPDEWWTISSPSQPRAGDGTALCHFQNGVVVGSYSTPLQSPDPIQQMDAAACNGPDDCWFGGYDDTSPDGARRGAFELHWDGTALTSTYAPFGHAISGITVQNGSFFESSFLGARPNDTTDTVEPPDQTSTPALIHRIVGGQIADDPFRPQTLPSASELLAIRSDGSQAWAVGGGAASGTNVPQGTSIARPPLAGRSDGGAFTEVPIDASLFGSNDRFTAVAPVPGTSDAWVAVQPFALQGSTTSKAEVVELSPSGVVPGTLTTLPQAGAGRGVVSAMAFSAPNDGWLATSAGWIFHYTDGTPDTPNNDPYWQGTIAFRPNEAAAQSVPDTPPPDDSLLFAPPPPPTKTSKPPKRKVKILPPALKHVVTKLRGLTLFVSFEVVRPTHVELIARRGSTIVAHTPNRLLHRGRHTFALKLNRSHYPTRLQLKTHERGQSSGHRGPGPNTVTTGARVRPKRSSSDPFV